jgi:hypothetical protein
MPHPPSAYDLHQRQRWTRHDAHLWIRHDAARFYKPGTDLAEVFPMLQRQREAAEDAAFTAKISASRRLLAALRAEVDEMKAASARRRLEEAKYSPSQPRVPGGNPRGGQWTDRSGGQSQGTGLAQPTGNVELGDVSGSSELGDLFQIKPDETPVIGEQVAGERQGGYPVDLIEERELGGHAIEGHIRSDQSLKSDLEARVAEAVRKGDSVSDMRQGSFVHSNPRTSSLIQRLREIRNKLAGSSMVNRRRKISTKTFRLRPEGKPLRARTGRRYIFKTPTAFAL